MPASASLTVRTAQRPGNPERPTEDRIYTAPNAVIVLDGATQHRQLDKDGGWIADQLGQRLSVALTATPDADLVQLLETAIADIVHRHRLEPGAAPSTTVNVVRWDNEHLDVLVLCDSPVIVLDTNNQIHQIRDDRLARIQATIRPRGGPRTLDPDELNRLVNTFEAKRNQPGGFWCVSATPEAARHAITWRTPLTDVHVVLAITDGVSAGVDDYGSPPDWQTAIHMAINDPATLINHVHTTETTDPDTTRWPRTKVHDDKAAAVILPIAC